MAVAQWLYKRQCDDKNNMIPIKINHENNRS